MLSQVPYIFSVMEMKKNVGEFGVPSNVSIKILGIMPCTPVCKCQH